MNVSMNRPDRSASADGGIEVRQLWPADIAKLRLAHHARLDEADIAALIVQRPGMSCWVSSTGEFAVITPWRHRSDLVTVHTLSAFEHERTLLDEVKRLAHASSIDAVIIVDMDETRPPSFYDANGFRRVEEIVTYHHRRPRDLSHAAGAGRLRFIQIGARDTSLLRSVHELDNASFPWLWWNSEAEFASYVRYPGVEIWAGFLGDRLLAYVGLTNYREWSHLDRIATHPDHQGQGLGREALLFAVQRMARQGARSVALSTQATNARSRKLYEDVGFVRTADDDYSIYAAGEDDRLFPGMHDAERTRTT